MKRAEICIFDAMLLCKWIVESNQGPIIIIKTVCHRDVSRRSRHAWFHEQGWSGWPGPNYNAQSSIKCPPLNISILTYSLAMSLWLLRDQVYRVPNTQKNEIQVYYHDNQRVEKKRSSDVSKKYYHWYCGRRTKRQLRNKILCKLHWTYRERN